MFVLEGQENRRVPIKVWLGSKEELEPACLQQAQNLAEIPFVHKWVALMPDTHPGYGMPVGGVVALKDMIIPNAVGVDIGCGVAFSGSTIPADHLDEETGGQIIREILKRVPVGFKHHENAQNQKSLKEIKETYGEILRQIPTLYKEVDQVSFQLGTLGGGNHFIEIQRDDRGVLALMVHSGSRNLGKKIAEYFNEKALLYVKKHHWNHYGRNQLAFFPADSETGKAYQGWMNFAMGFAQANREAILKTVQDILKEQFLSIEFEPTVSVHHNYVCQEEHFGEWVWVHRKGAIRAGLEEVGIIPGAMGMASYLVEGLGNPESFTSCSHGAGRHLSRKEAFKTINPQVVYEDLKARGVQVGTPDMAGLVDESRFVYKEIDAVMVQQQDLVRPLRKLQSVLVVKG